MFATIKGNIQSIEDNSVVVECNNIGYRVFVTSYTLGNLSGRPEVFLYLHTYVREEILALYGFIDRTERAMFELLISISGIGPKAALNILSIADPKTIRTAIAQEDESILTRVSGVGKKTAQRVILELKNKLPDIAIDDQQSAVADSETLEALVSMGYTVSEARDALKRIPENVTDIGARVRYALKDLGKTNS